MNVIDQATTSTTAPTSSPTSSDTLRSSIIVDSQVPDVEIISNDTESDVGKDDIDDDVEDEISAAIELARFIKSGGTSRPLYELELEKLQARPADRPVRQEGIRQSKTKAVLSCGCSLVCDGRCRCRKASRDCQPHCHSGTLRDSISGNYDSVCCGNTRITIARKKIWPAGWTITETLIGRGEQDVAPSRIHNFWEMQVLDRTPAAMVIQKAGGIDAFLIQEGYGHEFGLKQGISLTSKAKQATEHAEMVKLRRSEPC